MQNKSKGEVLIEKQAELIKKIKTETDAEKKKELNAELSNVTKLIELIDQYRDILKKKREASTEEEKERLSKLASKKYDEMMMCEFGDRNFKRFNQF